MKEKVTVVKVGGNIIEEEGVLHDFIATFREIKGHKLLVHGGGKVATKMAATLGIESQLIEGRRITGDEMIDVAVMTYAGLVNKKIVALLQSEGISAIGLTGADGNTILADKRPVQDGIDYGWVGDIKEVDGAFVTELIRHGITPVFCALTHDGQGHMLNTNADTIANEIAIALAEYFEVALNYCFELKGVMRDVEDAASVIKEIDHQTYLQLKNEGVVSAGMIPKLDNAFNAIDRGVQCVNILNLEGLKALDNPDYHEYTTIH